jgi:hypothetical protein
LETPRRGEVLVAIVNQPADLDIARQEHWYRAAARSVDRFLEKPWPPD